MKRLILILLFAVIIIGCTNEQQLDELEATKQELDLAISEIEKLEDQIKGMEIAINQLKDTTAELKNEKIINAVKIQYSEMNRLLGYSILEHQYGKFPIKVSKIEENFNSYTLTLNVGNTTSATYLNAKLHFVFPDQELLQKLIGSNKNINSTNYKEFDYFSYDVSEKINKETWTIIIIDIPKDQMKETSEFYLMIELLGIEM